MEKCLPRREERPYGGVMDKWGSGVVEKFVKEWIKETIIFSALRPKDNAAIYISMFIAYDGKTIQLCRMFELSKQRYAGGIITYFFSSK